MWDTYVEVKLLLVQRHRRKTLGGQIYTISQRRSAQGHYQYRPCVKFRKRSEHAKYIKSREYCSTAQHVPYAGLAEYRYDAEYERATERRPDAGGDAEAKHGCYA